MLERRVRPSGGLSSSPPVSLSENNILPPDYTAGLPTTFSTVMRYVRASRIPFAPNPTLAQSLFENYG